MSLMLEALRRIESKSVDGPEEAADGYEEEPAVRAMPFEAVPEPAGKEPAPRTGRRWPEAVSRAYATLAEKFAKHQEVAILFTSPGDGEGKTSTVLGLAEALAGREAGEVLAVDGNLRRPELADWMEVEADRGLIDVLSGGVKWPDVILETATDGLSILPGRMGESVEEHPVEGGKLGRLLGDLRRKFRYVLFDGASLSYPETAEICRHFDGILLVMALGRTSRGEARQAVRIVDDCEGRLLGSVLTNDLPGR